MVLNVATVLIALCILDLLLIRTVAHSLLVGLPSDYNLLFPEGNEYLQAQVLFSKTTRFNATDYFMDAKECLTNSPRPLSRMKVANTYHRELSRLWHPKSQSIDPYPRKQRDCQYDASNFAVSLSNNVATVFAYDIHQHTCESSTTIKGGAVWEVFGIGDYALASCGYVDNMDNTYRMTCSLPKIPSAVTHSSSKNTQDKLCINITTVLMYEHFDGLSEVMLDWSHRYPPLRAVITDNLHFCMDHSQVSSDSSEKRSGPLVNASGIDVRIPDSVYWHTGLWLHDENVDVTPQHGTWRNAAHTDEQVRVRVNTTSTALSNLPYKFNPASGTSAYLYHTFQQQDITEHRIISNVTLHTLTALALRSPLDTAYKYTYQPMLLVYGGKIPSTALRTANQGEILDFHAQSNCQKRAWNSLICRQQWNVGNINDANNVMRSALNKMDATGHSLSVMDEHGFLKNFTYGWISQEYNETLWTLLARLNAKTMMLAKLNSTNSSINGVPKDSSAVKSLHATTPLQQEEQQQPHQQRRLNARVNTNRRHSYMNNIFNQRNNNKDSRYRGPAAAPQDKGKKMEQDETDEPDERSRMEYHFVGASHMRYIFDSVSEYYFGMEVLRDVPRKHDELQLGNLRYNFIANALHQVAFLSKLCMKLQNDTQAVNATVRARMHTLIFQTGAWDLSVASLRRVLEDPTVGKRLMGLFDGVLTGQHPCGRINHIVWLTSMPHQICFDDTKLECNGHRSYRINSAINAVNTFYLDKLFHSVRAASVNSKLVGRTIHELPDVHRIPRIPRLSVVDAYNIIKPRLAFDESGEVVCTNHFSCRFTSATHFNYSTDGYPSVLVHTPGGMALVKSILNALML